MHQPKNYHVKILSMIFLGLILLGVGCANTGTDNQKRTIGAGGDTAPLSQDRGITDFCQNHRQIAEQKIGDFQLKPELRRIFELWKRRFMELNRINEATFNERILITWIWENDRLEYGKTMGYTFYYYVKTGDFYLETQDSINVKKEKLQKFDNQSVKASLSKLIPTKRSPFYSEPHPDFGRLERSYIERYEWGWLEINNMHTSNSGQLPNVMSCQEAVAELKLCEANLTPSRVVFRPTLNYARLSGETPERLRRDDASVCASASVDLSAKKLDDCLKGLSCNREIP